MLLDEPTNHLDIDAREALMQALNNYEGAVILVSHDPHLVECVADRLWLVADGTCVPYEDDLEAYRNLIVNQRRKERKEAREATRSNKKVKSKSKASPLEKEAQKLENKVADLTTERNVLENEIAEMSQKGGGKALTTLNISYARLLKDLEVAQNEWVEIQEKLEATTQG